VVQIPKEQGRCRREMNRTGAKAVLQGQRQQADATPQHGPT